MLEEDHDFHSFSSKLYLRLLQTSGLVYHVVQWSCRRTWERENKNPFFSWLSIHVIKVWSTSKRFLTRPLFLWSKPISEKSHESELNIYIYKQKCLQTFRRMKVQVHLCGICKSFDNDLSTWVYAAFPPPSPLLLLLLKHLIRKEVVKSSTHIFSVHY